jgi:predicted MFS family arabinose efflux permease
MQIVTATSSKHRSVFEGVTAYHWLVVVVAAAGWVFDCMDQRIFALCRESALGELVPGASVGAIRSWGGWATAAMMVGWATGGIVFGTMSDRLGRRSTMVVTLLVYSAFTAISGLAQGPYEFLLYRLLTGLGIGGMFGAATTLVAESVPDGFRSVALGALQTLSATGNLVGSVLSTSIQPGRASVMFGLAGWRVLFFVGLFPALIVAPILLVLKEPAAWSAARARGGSTTGRRGPLRELLADRRWRKNLFVGLGLGLAGMAGLWGIGFFSPELVSSALRDQPQAVVDSVRGWGTAAQDIGSFFGMLAFTFVATYLGRRVAFGGAFVLCIATTTFVFNRLSSATDAYWMLPLMGFAQLSVFGGYSIYFPELFPTRLRGTGVGLCYNAVRYLAAGFPIALMALNEIFIAQGAPEPFRKSATVLSGMFVLGLITLRWAPETKGEPLLER